MIEYAARIPVAPEDDVYLQATTHDDGDMLHEFITANRAHLVEFQPQVAELASRGETRNAVTERMQAISEGTSLQYRIMRAAEMVGTVTLFDRKDATAKLGYFLGASVLGRGYASRSSRTLLAYAADVWDLSAVTMHISDHNVPSQHVARSLGAVPTENFSSERTIDPIVWRTLRIWEKHL